MNQASVRVSPVEPFPLLSEALWQRLAACIAAAEPTLAPSDARRLLETLLSRQLAGVRWADGPGAEAAAVETAYRRWRASGLLDQLAQLLRIRLDEDDAAPS